MYVIFEFSIFGDLNMNFSQTLLCIVFLFRSVPFRSVPFRSVPFRSVLLFALYRKGIMPFTLSIAVLRQVAWRTIGQSGKQLPG